MFILSVVLLPCCSAIAQEPSAAQLKFFEMNIRPALVKYCYECHSVEAGDSRAGLLLDSREGILEGGDNGAALVPGNLDESLLWEAINWDGNRMPPSKRMPAAVIAKFRQWIEMGAPDPRERRLLHVHSKISAKDIEDGRSHWAFQPPRSTAEANIDRLVAAKLREQGLQAVELADSLTLLRRINFDLVGLPPTPSEMELFQIAWSQNADAAVEAKVDELLERPQYGERWGRHWLDVARYAESSGSRNVSYPHAWRYRDYVIDSFNDDTPYDRFIAEQIAGDLLPADTDQQWQRNLIATGFLAIGMKHHDEKNPRKFMADLVDEQIDTVTQAVLGLTVSCARCHDHKYDPIPTHDYYALAGIFYSTSTFYGTERIAQNHRPSDLLLLPIQEKASVAGGRRSQSYADLQARVAELDRQMSRMRRGKDFKLMRNNRNRVAGQLAALNPDGTAKSFGMGVQDRDQMINANILLGGEVDQPAQQVPRGFVQILGDLNFTVTDGNSSGRRELVNAMSSKNNPLTARVMANRIWLHLLGKPIVGTPSNFGLAGMKPENQALLDYLAVRFMDQGWSIKSLIREIVLSKAYRRSSRYDEHNFAADPDNNFLWRANPRQLDAEAMRDAMLALSGRLDLERPNSSAVAAGRPGRPGAATFQADDTHRAVYLPVVRDGLLEPLKLFDFPDPNTTSSGRTESIVPTQALYMMNGQFVIAQAEAMAARLARRHSRESDQIRNAILWVYGRPATEAELLASTAFFQGFQPPPPVVATAAVQEQPSAESRRGRAEVNGGSRGRRSQRMGRRSQTPETAGGTRSPGHQALAVFCQTLMASARFRILN